VCDFEGQLTKVYKYCDEMLHEAKTTKLLFVVKSPICCQIMFYFVLLSRNRIQICFRGTFICKLKKNSMIEGGKKSLLGLMEVPIKYLPNEYVI
jgi:hypothetical protein